MRIKHRVCGKDRYRKARRAKRLRPEPWTSERFLQIYGPASGLASDGHPMQTSRIFAVFK